MHASPCRPVLRTVCVILVHRLRPDRVRRPVYFILYTFPGSGLIWYNELNKLLPAGQKVRVDPCMIAGAMGEIKMDTTFDGKPSNPMAFKPKPTAAMRKDPTLKKAEDATDKARKGGRLPYSSHQSVDAMSATAVQVGWKKGATGGCGKRKDGIARMAAGPEPGPGIVGIGRQGAVRFGEIQSNRSGAL